MAKRMTKAEKAEHAAKCQRRLDDFNQWLGTVSLEEWDVFHPVTISGYVVGIFMKRKADGYTILGTGPEALANIPQVGAKGGK